MLGSEKLNIIIFINLIFSLNETLSENVRRELCLCIGEHTKEARILHDQGPALQNHGDHSEMQGHQQGERQDPPGGGAHGDWEEI